MSTTKALSEMYQTLMTILTGAKVNDVNSKNIPFRRISDPEKNGIGCMPKGFGDGYVNMKHDLIMFFEENGEGIEHLYEKMDVFRTNPIDTWELYGNAVCLLDLYTALFLALKWDMNKETRYRKLSKKANTAHDELRKSDMFMRALQAAVDKRADAFNAAQPAI